jgi:exonuclease SbcD
MGKSREKEHEAFLSWLLDVLKEKEVQLLLVSGDIFDTQTPPNYALELYYDFLKELSGLQTLNATIITAGNHDSISTLKAPKKLLQALNVHVITSGDKDEDVIIPVGSPQKALVCAVPFLRDSVIRQSFEGQTISDKEKLANEGIKAYYQNVYEKALQRKNAKDIPVIATGHLTTVGSRTSQSERDIYIGGTLDIGGDYLASMFDYVALGHLHINQKVGVDNVRYSGAPIPLSFSESKNTQKVNLVSLGKKIRIEELAVPLYRKLLVIKGDVKTIQKELSAVADKNSWIEVHVNDDNPMHANSVIREFAAKLELKLLAVRVQKSEKQLRAKEMQAISLDELSVNEVFEKRLAIENIEDKEFEKELIENFSILASKAISR